MITTSVFKWMFVAIFRFDLYALHKQSWGRAPARLQYSGGYEQLQENGSNLQQTPTVFCCIYHSSSKHSFKWKGENPWNSNVLKCFLFTMGKCKSENLDLPLSVLPKPKALCFQSRRQMSAYMSSKCYIRQYSGLGWKNYPARGDIHSNSTL